MRDFAPAGAGIVLVSSLNALILASSANDGGWGTAGLLLLYGPLANLALLMGLVALAPAVRHLAGRSAVGAYGLVALALPPLYVLLGWAVVALVPPHGC